MPTTQRWANRPTVGPLPSAEVALTRLARSEPSASPLTLSVIIVNYNAGDLLATCVGSVLASRLVTSTDTRRLPGDDFEILVSDNGSTDQSLARLRAAHGADPRLTVIENGVNLGFARGNNVALPWARGRYLLFLNPDCVLAADTLARLVTFMETTTDAAMAGGVVRNPDGTEQVASRRVIPDPWIGLVSTLRLDRLWPRLLASKRLDRTDEPLPLGPIRVEAISGSFMLVRRAALDVVGPLDEGYFLHGEDLDWFMRFRLANQAIYLLPEVQVIHYKGGCSGGRPVFVEWHKHRSMARFFHKYQARQYSLAFSWLVFAGIWLHFGFLWVKIGVQRLVRSGVRR